MASYDSDSDTISVSTNFEDVDDSSELEQPESWWDDIVQDTYQMNISNWKILSNTDTLLLKKNFQEAFLENCKKWLAKLHDFVETDGVWSAILDTKDKVNKDIDDEDEALLSAIDTRRYKIYKVIDWENVLSQIGQSGEDEIMGDQEGYAYQ
jgi:uncharacterized Zn-finger protein